MSILLHAGRKSRGRRMLFAATALVAILASLPVRAGTGPAKSHVAPALAKVMSESTGSIPVIVRFSDGPTKSDGKAMREAGFAPGMIRYQVVPAFAARGSASAIRAIARNPRVAWVEHDAKIPYALDRAVKATRADRVWDATYKSLGEVHTGGFDGAGIGIAIVDGGIDATHPDLIWKPLAEQTGKTPKTVRNFKVVGRDSIELVDLASDIADDLTEEENGIADFVEANMLAIDVPDSDTTGGHGTHVAGIAAGTGAASDGKYKGAAPGANLIGFGAGETLVVSSGLAAFDYIHQHHADPELNIRVVNNSWGGAGDWDAEAAVTIAARRLVNDDGIVVLFAAGNDGGNGTAIDTSVWANIPEMISVANYYDRTGWVDSSSSRGLRTLERTWPDVAAPGTQIISTAANGKPVTYYGSAQDALINELDETHEPDVVPAPLPSPVEVSAGGKTVMAGNYASFTGTSMATPFVAGVAALILQANPALTPAQVKTILRETANLPIGRTYKVDGFAVGKGVVDATEAVAAALRMKDGLSLDDALRTAYVNSAASPAELNLVFPRRLEITSPSTGGGVSGSSVSVSGSLLTGPVTDNSIPLAPAPVAVSGTPLIFQGGQVNPFAAGGLTPAVLPGEPVSMRVQAIHSNSSAVTLALPDLTASHVVKRPDGSIAYGPFSATVAAETTAGNFRSTNSWTVPADAPMGDYVFVGTITLASTSQTYQTASLPFTIGLNPPSHDGNAFVVRPDMPSIPLGGNPLMSSTTFFSDDFEGADPGWTMTQDAALGQGRLTEWARTTNRTVNAWIEPHSGVRQWYVGQRPGAVVSGANYTGDANTSLVSPPIDLSSASSASVTYWRAGQSETDYDFLRVYAKQVASAAWTQIDEVSGDFLFGDNLGDWESATADLSAFAGAPMQIRFEFTSDDNTSFAGWHIDDVVVTGSEGTPTAVIVPSLSTSDSSGLGSLSTAFTYSATSNVPITGYSLDFGDGSDALVATEAGAIAHTYSTPGQYVATLTVTTASASESTSVPIDVAPTGEIQVRIGGGAWVDAGAATGLDDALFSAFVDVTGLEPGPALLEVRHFDASGRLMTASIEVVVS